MYHPNPLTRGFDLGRGLASGRDDGTEPQRMLWTYAWTRREPWVTGHGGAPQALPADKIITDSSLDICYMITYGSPGGKQS